jgi:hypothetical protein
VPTAEQTRRHIVGEHRMSPPDRSILEIDFVNQVPVGQTLDPTPTVTLVRVLPGPKDMAASLDGGPVVTGTVVTQAVLGAGMARGETYWLSMTVQVMAGLAPGARHTRRVEIICV